MLDGSFIEPGTPNPELGTPHLEHRGADMSILVVGSVALDSVRPPWGEVKEALGGSATSFLTAASFFADVRVVAVVGEDFPEEHLAFFKSRSIDLQGLERGGG